MELDKEKMLYFYSYLTTNQPQPYNVVLGYWTQFGQGSVWLLPAADIQTIKLNKCMYTKGSVWWLFHSFILSCVICLFPAEFDGFYNYKTNFAQHIRFLWQSADHHSPNN